MIPETVNSWCELVEKGKIQQQIKQSLMLSAAEDYRDGYIYVFAKAKDHLMNCIRKCVYLKSTR